MKFLKYFFALLVILQGNAALAQTGINTRTPYKSAAVDINTPNKGFLITRVLLTSKADITTVPNPAKGMVVIATQSSAATVRANDKVTIGILYKFNGSRWEEIIAEEHPANGVIGPEIVAYGEKTSSTDINGNSSGSFALESKKKYRPAIILNNDGSLTADRDGYYNWSVKIFFFSKNSAGTGVGTTTTTTEKLGHFSPANVIYSFEAAADATTWAWQPFSVSGTVFLNAGQTSVPFSWRLVNNNKADMSAVSGDLVGKQTIIWLYAGN